MINMVRSKIISVIEGSIKRFSAYGRTNETFSSREAFQHYGFSSIPLPGAEGITFIKGNQVFLIAEDDRRYRVALAEGEVAIYTDEGDKIHFKRGNEILIKTSNKVTVEADTEAEVTAPTVTVNGDATVNGDVTIDGDVDITGTLHAGGNITGDGTIIDATGNTNNHSHP